MELIWDLIVQYGWQAVTIAVITCVLIELLKPLVRKLVKNKNIRHVLYYVLRYVVALGLTAILALILHRLGDLFELYGPAMVVVNVMGQVFSNIGFFEWIEKNCSNIWSKVTESGIWRKAIKEVGSAFGVDEALLDTIATKVENQYLPLIEAGASAFFTDNKEELILNLKQKLAGFVSNDKLQELAETLFKKLAASWKVDDTVSEEKQEA